MHTLSEISEKLLGRFLELSENSQFSYTDLSNLTGISRSALQRYLTGETKKFPLDRVELIAKALNLPMAYGIQKLHMLMFRFQLSVRLSQVSPPKHLKRSSTGKKFPLQWLHAAIT